MRQSDIHLVRTVPLFESMDDSGFEALMRAAYLQTVPAQLELVTEGDPADFLHIVIEGCVELYAQSNNRETTVEMVHPVRAFILAAVLKDAVYLMSARTCARSKILLVPSENIREAFESDPQFAQAIIRELATAYRAMVREHKDLKLRTSVERLANRLLRYHRDQGGAGAIELPYDKRTLAALLGMTPENLSRAFNTLKPYDVEVNGAKVTLRDIASLETLAKPNPLIDDDKA